MNEIRLIQQQPSVYQQQALAQPYTTPLVPTGQALPGVYTITAPDGTVHHVYGPAAGQPVMLANTPLPVAETRPLVHPVLVNLAVGAMAFAAVAFGLHLLVGFIAALAQLVTTLITLAAVLIGGWVAIQILAAARGSNGRAGNTTNIHIKKAVFKRSTFRS